MLHCNGKCQMLKKLKKQEGDTGAGTTAPKFNQPDVVLSSKSFFPSLAFCIVYNSKLYTNHNILFASNYLSSIFRPPSNCNTI